MKSSTVIGIIAAIIVLGGIAWYFLGPASLVPSPSATQTSTQPQAAAPATQAAPASSGTSATITTTTTTVISKSFAVNGNDATADLKTITVAAGTPVTITFGADAGTTYHGGLDFRSSVMNTGTIKPGSTKTISFVATKSFSFTPYWPATNIAKPYTIDIVVQ